MITHWSGRAAELSWDWERELSDELMIESYLKAKWRCGVETVTTAGREESEKGPLRPEAWRTTGPRKQPKILRGTCNGRETKTTRRIWQGAAKTTPYEGNMEIGRLKKG